MGRYSSDSKSGMLFEKDPEMYLDVFNDILTSRYLNGCSVRLCTKREIRTTLVTDCIPKGKANFNFKISKFVSLSRLRGYVDVRKILSRLCVKESVQ